MPIPRHTSATRTPEYEAWRQMIARCRDPRDTRWPRYGGLGVRVHEEWRSFDAFHGDMGRRPEGHVLSRRDMNGDYTPENCYWERREDARRRYRLTRTFAYEGETLSLADWSHRTGLPALTIRNRLLVLGWSVGQALGFEPRSLTRFRGPQVVSSDLSRSL